MIVRHAVCLASLWPCFSWEHHTTCGPSVREQLFFFSYRSAPSTLCGAFLSFSFPAEKMILAEFQSIQLERRQGVSKHWISLTQHQSGCACVTGLSWVLFSSTFGCVRKRRLWSTEQDLATPCYFGACGACLSYGLCTTSWRTRVASRVPHC